jgi:putative endonuclease
MSDDRQVLGALGERIAARWLARQGWVVVARRFRSGHRDVDLIVRRDGVVAFVEVKTRRGLLFGDPVAQVGWRKRRELVRSAQVWLDRHGRPGETYRFDVVGVLVTGADGGPGDPFGPTPRVRVRHVAGAFDVPADV